MSNRQCVRCSCGIAGRECTDCWPLKQKQVTCKIVEDKSLQQWSQQYTVQSLHSKQDPLDYQSIVPTSWVLLPAPSLALPTAKLSETCWFNLYCLRRHVPSFCASKCIPRNVCMPFFLVQVVRCLQLNCFPWPFGKFDDIVLPDKAIYGRWCGNNLVTSALLILPKSHTLMENVRVA